MNPFSQLQNDTIYIEKNTGERTGPYKTTLAAKNGFSARVFDATLEAEEGWKVVRILPANKEEIYTIIETAYSAGLDAIPPSWNLVLEKDSSMRKKPAVKKNTTINISNSQGIQVGDHNVQSIELGFQTLIQQISSSSASEKEKQEARGLLVEMLNNPIVAGVLGGATSGLLALLG